MSGVGYDGAIFHDLKMRFADHADITGQGAKDIPASGCFFDCHYAKPIHYRLKCS